MQVPKKVNICFTKPVPTKKVKTIKQPIPKNVDFWVNNKKSISKEDMEEMLNDKPRSSKLEYIFMRNFLDKLGIKYIHQFFVPTSKNNGFIYDFAILDQSGLMIELLLEIQGTYFHCDPRVYTNGPLYETQKKQIIRDNIKMKTAAYNGFSYMTIWEMDIHNSPEDVLNELKKRCWTKFDKK